jgi:uncharacterized protein
MDFDWDPKKAKANKLKHGVDFELAKDVFRDPACLSSLDDSSADEERWRYWPRRRQGPLCSVYGARRRCHPHHLGAGSEPT